MSKGIKPPKSFHGKVGRSGRKKASEEAIKHAKEQLYQELFREIVPDALLAAKHKELLTVPTKVRKFVKGELKTETEQLDANAISKGLDLAYKLRGDYAPEKMRVETVIPDSEEIKRLANLLNDIHRGTSQPGHGALPGPLGEEV